MIKASNDFQISNFCLESIVLNTYFQLFPSWKVLLLIQWSRKFWVVSNSGSLQSVLCQIVKIESEKNIFEDENLRQQGVKCVINTCIRINICSPFALICIDFFHLVHAYLLIQWLIAHCTNMYFLTRKGWVKHTTCNLRNKTTSAWIMFRFVL